MEHPGTLGRRKPEKEGNCTHTHTRNFGLRKQVRENEKVPTPITVNITTYRNIVPIFTPLWDRESGALSFFRQNNFKNLKKPTLYLRGNFGNLASSHLHFSFATSKFIYIFSMWELFINHLCLSFNGVVLNACGTNVFFGDKILGHSFDPKYGKILDLIVV
jgi:hypothetical protein